MCRDTVSRGLGFHIKIFLQAETEIKIDLFWHKYLPQVAAETTLRARMYFAQLYALNFQPTFTVCETSSAGTAPDHMLCRRKSNVQVSCEKRTMVHTMQFIGIFFPLYHPVICTLQRSMQLPQTRNVELQVGSHGSFGVHADLLVFFCEMGTCSFPEVADTEVFPLFL